MIEQHFRDILKELERFDFREMLNLIRERFCQEHKEEELLVYFEVCLHFNWKKAEEVYIVEAEKIMPLLRNLSDESKFCLYRFSIDPVIDYVDAAGVERKYRVNEAWISYDGDVQPHWQELHYKIEGGKEQVAFRENLTVGRIVAQTSAGPLKVLSMSDCSLSLMLGTDVERLEENCEYMKECLKGVETGLYYNHHEFPALWSWLHVDDENNGYAPWYHKYHEQKEDLYEGMTYIDGDPTVTIVKINDRSVTLSLGFGLQGRIHPKTIVLDQPNKEVVIWEHLDRRLKAKLYVPEPSKKMSSFFDSDPVPSGCRVTAEIVLQGHETIDYTRSMDVRSVPCSLIEGYPYGVIWNRFDVWGFVGGKMAVGIDSPQFNSGRCAFRGLLSPGKLYTFPINDDDGDGVNVHHGQITVGWEIVEVGLEIKDGVLMSIPDVKEFVVPDEVCEIHFQAFLTAPSLRKITLRAGVKRYWCAINTYYDERHVKLDVAFEGSLQEWFDSANYLASYIGRLEIQGKEYDFYETEELVIPEGVSRIGEHIFSDCETIRSLVLPPEVVEVGDHAFAYCNNLQSVKVLGPASIGDSAFVSCKKLSSIYLADGVVSLGYGCFDFLTKVESIFIPKSVERALILSGQNDGSRLAPVFLCEAPSKPSGWVKNWNLSYFDPRFGLGHGHDHFHPVKWGCKRE